MTLSQTRLQRHPIQRSRSRVAHADAHLISTKDDDVDLEPSSLNGTLPKKSSSSLHLNWLLQIIFQPRQTFSGIVAEEKQKTWLTPIVAVSLLLIVAALISTFLTASATPAAQVGTRTTQAAQTIRTAAANRGGNQGNQPGGFQGAPPGALPGGDFGGGGFVNPGGGTTTTTTGSNAATASSTNIWLSLLWPVVNFLITWLLLGGLTNLFSLAGGGKSHALMAMNIAAWSTIPIGVRNMMQIIYYLASGSAIQAPGLSGFLTVTNSQPLLIFAQFLLARVDLYLFWQIGLLAVGVAIWGGVTRKKAVVIAAVVVIIVVALQSLVGLGVTLLGNVNLNAGALLRLR